ncbi:MAG: rhamnogalacturonan lyase [Prevotella sp.]|nr:rhamnogalacturonan lyase [Prevotella sp.]
MKKLISILVLGMLVTITASSQPNYSASRQQEVLGRALTAVSTDAGKTYLSWRYFEGDNQKYSYELYHNGTKIGSFKRTNYLYPIESESSDTYELRVVDGNGNVVETDQTSPWTGGMLRIPLSRPTTNSATSNTVIYKPNDCSIGDVDGDGVMEIFVKWDPSTSQDNSKSGKTDNVIIDCYRLDGTLVWRVDLGPNIRAGAHYTQFLVYDFDGDGKVEMMCKTAPWSKDGNGNYVSKAATDETIKNETKNTTSYRNSSGYVLSGPEFLTVFSGTDGHAIHTIYYNPNRAGNFNEEGTYPDKSFWGDNYGNRSDRYLSAVAYLDGEKPSAIFCRGYYTRAYVWAVDFDGTSLQHRWLHASVSTSKVEHYDANWNKTTKTYTSNTSGNGSLYTLYGNGNHNMTIGDVDGDGKDEIIYGSGAVDDDGQLLYVVGFGHGDAIHMGTFDPSKGGKLQVFDVHEETVSGVSYGWDLHDAATGEVLYSAAGSSDNDRGICGHFLSTVEEAVFSSSNDRQQRSAKTGAVVNTKSSSVNYRIYWDEDLTEEFMDGGYYESSDDPVLIKKLTGSSLKTVSTISMQSCNTTKRSPNLQADLFGDWREEVILHDDDALYVYMNTTPTDYVVPCLLTDHIYRMAIAWQQSAYNQPPHLGYYLPSKAIEITDDDVTVVPDDYVQEYEEATATIVWGLHDGTIDEEPTITISGDVNVDFETSISCGSQLTVSGQESITGGAYTETKFKALQKNTTASEGQTVTFSMTPSNGFKFMPTSVDFIASRFGTNGGAIDVVWKTEGSSVTCLSGQQPLRNKDYTTTDSDGNSVTVNQSPYYSAFSAQPGTNYIGGTSNLLIQLYNLAENKEIGLCSITVKGTLRRTVPIGTNTPTGISEFTIPQWPIGNDSDAIYTLQGVKIDGKQNIPAGIYIQRGRKVIIK